MMGYSLVFFVLICSIFLAAGAIQALSGFGSSLIIVPLLTATTNVYLAVVAATAISTLLSTIMAVVNHRYINWRFGGVIVLASVIGIPIGIGVLAIANPRMLSFAACAVAVLALIAVWRGFHLRALPFTMGATGVAIGLLGAATGINGAPAVAVYRGLGLSDQAMRANLALLFAVVDTITLVMYVPAGRVTLELGSILLLGLPALLLGWIVGARIARRLDPERFRKIILALLVGTALAAASKVLIA